MPILERPVEVLSNTGKCIYCGEEKAFSREHYLPECLGRFEGFDTLDDRICHDCNNHCGKELEDQFCRAGHTGYMRYALGIGGKKSHKERVNPFERGSSGSSPLRMKGKIPGQEQEVHLQLVKGRQEGSKVGIDYVPQVILETDSGEIHYILLTHMKEPEELEAKLKELGIEKFKQANLIAAESEIEWVEKLTSRLPIAGKAKWEQLPVSGSTYTDTEFEVTDKYFRAIAKIAFHYILKYFTHFRGDEEFFTGIRNFIMNGGNIQEYVTWSENQIIEQIKAGYTPTTFGHVIIARANQERIWSRLQFFLGPDSAPFVYKVAVANHKPALYYDITSGHQFCYNADGLKDGRIGVMDELTYLHKAPTAGS